MKTTHTITAAAGDLCPAVAALGKVVKKTANLPVLQCLRVDPVSRERFRLTGADLTTFFTIDVPGEVGEKSPSFLVPLARIQEQMRGATAREPIELRPGRTPLPGEFPETPRVQGQPIRLEPRFLEALHRALACASTDETRHVLNGARLDPAGGDACQIVGTDGRHLYAATALRLTGLKERVIIPPIPRSPCGNGSPPHAPSIRIGGDPGGSRARIFRLNGANWRQTGRLVDGNFPDYRQVIPDKEKFRTRVVLPGGVLDPLVKAIRRMPGGKSDNRPVGLRIAGEIRVSHTRALNSHPAGSGTGVLKRPPASSKPKPSTPMPMTGNTNGNGPPPSRESSWSSGRGGYTFSLAYRRVSPATGRRPPL